MQLQLQDGEVFPLDRPTIMGILNVTPDSFSDGGSHDVLGEAVEHAMLMVREGADIIDVGGESTRPGSGRVDAAEQIRRTVDVIRQVRLRIAQMQSEGKTSKRIAISIDTTRSEVAVAALDAGADILNDVSAGREDPAMLQLAATRGVPICLMHMQGEPGTMQNAPSYSDVVSDVLLHLRERVDAAVHAGVERSQIILDPGIGFGKTREHNLALLGALNQFVNEGLAVLLGTSRKRFMGSICTGQNGNPPLPTDLIGATCATTALGVAAGAHLFRVHDVKANRQAADVAWTIEHA
jgi:dihydropteroate synthase